MINHEKCEHQLLCDSAIILQDIFVNLYNILPFDRCGVSLSINEKIIYCTWIFCLCWPFQPKPAYRTGRKKRRKKRHVTRSSCPLSRDLLFIRLQGKRSNREKLPSGKFNMVDYYLSAQVTLGSRF